MMNYNDSNVNQCLRQYDMFANSLNLVKSRNERNMIITQLTKLENKIIELTNEIYEKEYNEILGKETYLMSEERDKIASLIDLIHQRLSYVEKRNNSHYQLTGEVVDASDVLGASTLESLEERISIIDKYQNNTKLISDLKEEIKTLSSKIELAEKKISINNSLNEELEKKMKNILKGTFDKLDLFGLLDNKSEYEIAFEEAEKCLTLAKQNLEIAKTSPSNMLSECQEMVISTEKDYIKYKEKICIIKLIEIYDRQVENYDELLIKRKEMNEILKNIKSKEFNTLINDELSKQYDTIMLEIQDVDNYNNLLSDKAEKETTLSEIEEENNSERFQDVLGELLENEKKRQKKLEEERLRIEEEERQKRIELEKKKQEEILRKQKVIEEARKKEMEKRTREMLAEQQNSVLQTKKDDGLSFDAIKSLSNDTDEELPPPRHEAKEEKVPEIEKQEEVEEKADFPMFKNKVDIERELFEEFNKQEEEPVKQEDKLPDISLDDYMNNFDENKVAEDNLNDLFKDDEFPSIPV